ncbi:MAG: IS66 family transposase [Streptomycetales bacterium]
MPEPEELSREDLLVLVAPLRAGDAAKDARIDVLLVQVGELTAQVQALVWRLGKDSSTSSKPPSSDGPDRRPRGGSSRGRSGRNPGKQPGGPRAALRLVDDPNERIPIPAPVACGCGCPLAEQPVSGVRRRQVHDLARTPPPVVTEYAAETKRWPGCGATAVGKFPAAVDAPAQYGSEVSAKAADVVLGHHVPVHRSTVLLMELCGIAVSTGWMASLRGRAAALLAEGFVPAVRDLLARAHVVHADETFTRAAGTTAYLHVATTEYLRLMHTGNRSAGTIDDGGVLTELSEGQVLVRDGYPGYAHLSGVLHAWCGAHLLRDLRGIGEADPDGQLWARAIADTLLEAHRIARAARAEDREALTDDELRTIHRLYTGALPRARLDNPAASTSVLAGHARTLTNRFDTHQEMILRFTTDPAVPFTNNLAERRIRPAKVQQRSPGGC